MMNEPEETPGPATYTTHYTDRALHPRFPKYSFGKAKRMSSSILETPGPGAHFLDEHIQHTKVTHPSLTIGTKYTKPGEGPEDTPAANAYNTDIRNFFRKTEAGKMPKGFTMAGPGARSKARAVTPGPSDYKVKNPALKRSPSYTLRPKTSNMKPVVDPSNPGPSDYSPIHRNDAAWSSTVKGKTFSLKMMKDEKKKITPGPGAYQLGVETGTERPAYTMGGRKDTITSMPTTETPGPAAYSPKVPLPEKHGRTMCGKYPDREGTGAHETPGVGTYNILRASTAPALTIPNEQRTSINPFQDNPGPGQYDPKKMLKDAPKYSMGLKRSTKKTEVTPGGDYKPKFQALSHKPGTPSYSIGRAKRGERASQDIATPGPGAYLDRDEKKFTGMVRSSSTRSLSSMRGNNATDGTGFTMGAHLNRDKAREATPGPLDYNNQPLHLTMGHTGSKYTMRGARTGVGKAARKMGHSASTPALTQKQKKLAKSKQLIKSYSSTQTTKYVFS